MREFKFRAWVRDEMVYNITILKIFQEDAFSKLMQWTGLKDKNGKDIYEGDILKIHPNPEDIFNVKIIFHEGSFCYTHKNGGIFTLYSEINWAGITKNREVIGNIFEDPELLEGEG